jgi:hypothetical protein
MSARTTWIKGKMWFPDDINPADIDWVKPVVAYPQPTTETVTGLRQFQKRIEHEFRSFTKRAAADDELSRSL